MSQPSFPPLAGIVLAAGKGTRMKSELPKSLHSICGAPMTQHVLNAFEEAGAQKIVVVVGHRAEQVQEALGNRYEYALQHEQKGTGHAAIMAAPLLKDFDGLILLAPGDAPLITAQALTDLVQEHLKTGAACTLATTLLENPFGYGRIVRDESGNVSGIIEEKDASPEQKAIKEVCTSFYCFDPKALFDTLPQLSSNNAQNEYYLTDVPGALARQGKIVQTLIVEDSTLLSGVNSRWELALCGKAMRARIAQKHALNGVTIVDPDTAYIDVGVEIGSDTLIHPMTILEGKTTIGGECEIGPYARIIDSRIGNSTVILASHVADAQVDDHVRVGPYANLRKGAILRSHTRVGDFVEVKNAELGAKSSASHLAYIGDAQVGENTNIGAGAITCNYDGFAKHRTIIGSNAFIGSNSTLIAPVEIGEGAFVAAGSAVTEDVPAEALCVARSRQTVKEGWVKRWRERR